jgi:hypothetical protein
MSAEVQQKVLALHNKLRHDLKTNKVSGQPCATDMVDMTWDNALAKTAQSYADKCKWGHNPDRTKEYKANGGTESYVGENLAAGYGGGYSALTGIQSWWDEYKDYTYQSKSCAAGKACGHYTQMAWSKSTKLGCGLAKCGSSFISGWPSGTFLVCNYGPGGNFNSQHPYQTSSSCTSSGGGTSPPPPSPTPPSGGSCKDGWSGCTRWASLCGKGYKMQGSGQKLDDFCGKTCGTCLMETLLTANSQGELTAVPAVLLEEPAQRPEIKNP